MKSILTEMARDWKNWIIFISGLTGIVISIVYDKDWTEPLWIFAALALYFVGNIQQIAMEKANEFIKEQDDLLTKADIIIKSQTELIKELEEKTNGKD